MAAASKRVWIGARKLTPVPGGVEVDTTDTTTAVLQFHGPYELCVAQKPNRGSLVAGYSGMRVDRSVVRKAKAPGFGEITVYLSKADEADGEGAEPLQEVYWLQVERDLIQHPRYQSGGAKALSTANQQQIALWMEQTNPTKKQSFIWEEKNAQGAVVNYGTLSAAAQDFAGKILKGIDSYLEFTPVATSITFSRTKPSTTRTCGKRVSKPFSACPDGYVWLRTEDRHGRTGRHGKWQRTQSWTGALAWDTDLYEAES